MALVSGPVEHDDKSMVEKPMTLLHRHDWRYMGGERVELRWLKKTFFVSVYQCKCGEYHATPVDMQPYLDMKEVHVGGSAGCQCGGHEDAT